jgi:hypothetical protein
MRVLLATVATVGILSLSTAGCGDSATTNESTTVAQAPHEFFGVVPQGLLTDEDLARMAQGKVGTIRLVIPWGALVPTKTDTEVNLSTIDPVVLGAAEKGIRVVPTIYGTPAWVAEDLDGYNCDPGCGPFAPTSEAALAAWKDFVGQMVDRYGPGGSLWTGNAGVDAVPVRTWQIWNEQNSPTFYQPKVDPAAYEHLLAAASEAINERDPNAEVILGGMFGTPFKGEPPALSAPVFLRDLYAIDGAADTFDAVAAHPYAARESKITLQVKLLHDEITRAHDNAGMWITEVGASSEVGDKPGDNPLLLGPEGQAQQLRTAFQFFLDQRQALDIEGVTWYSWRDTSDPNQCDWCPGSGLFEEASLTPKPAWAEFVSFTGGS